MPVGKAVQPRSVLAMTNRFSVTLHGLLKTRDTSPIRLTKRSQTHGACMTCTEVFRNGAATGMASTLIPSGRSPIPRVQKRARSACAVAAVGAAQPRVVGRLPGTGATRRSGSGKVAFAST